MQTTKFKTHRGACKRFRKSGSGIIKHRQTNRSHLNTKMSAKKVLHLRKNITISSSDRGRIKAIIK